jgi:hypothetical protein
MSGHHDDPTNSDATELVLQDSRGDDEKLQALFEYLASEINKDAPKRPNKRLAHLMGKLSAPIGEAWKRTAVAVGWIADRLLDFDGRKAKADEIHANAELKRSQARVAEIEAQANSEKALAEAEAIRTKTRMKLLRELKEAGLDWRAAVAEDGELKITVTRQPRIDQDFDAGKPR